MNVYVVLYSYDSGDSQVVAVFSTAELAEQYVSAGAAYPNGSIHDWEIVEIGTDTPSVPIERLRDYRPHWIIHFQPRDPYEVTTVVKNTWGHWAQASDRQHDATCYVRAETEEEAVEKATLMFDPSKVLPRKWTTIDVVTKMV